MGSQEDLYLLSGAQVTRSPSCLVALSSGDDLPGYGELRVVVLQFPDFLGETGRGTVFAVAERGFVSGVSTFKRVSRHSDVQERFRCGGYFCLVYHFLFKTFPLQGAGFFSTVASLDRCFSFWSVVFL